MASSALNVLSGIAAAAAGFHGETVSKNGSVPGLDLAKILPAMLGDKAGGAAGLLGSLASVASKSGLFGGSKMGNLADLAGSLLSSGSAGAVSKAAGGIGGLAAAIMGNSGSAASLGSIASLATKIGKTATSKNDLLGKVSELGKTLGNTCGISLNGGGTVLKALDNVLGNDAKGTIFKTILKGLA
ncbi:MAG: hypothetical protein FWG27_06235 [Treponema sp.]|nr:hypothetical protein [Treponema sp.]